jgi:hypothetical protein
MNDGDPRYLEPRSNPRAAGGSRWFQFSLASVFVLVTATALILSTFFSVGRLVGMSNMEVTQWLEMWLFPQLPILLVWIVGLMMAIRRRKGNRVAATLTLIALCGMVLTTLVFDVVFMMMFHWPSGWSPGWSITITGYLEVVVQMACWILILLAIFARRPPDDPEPEWADPSRGPPC